MAHPRIVFMGTPDFAVASLKQLVEGGCNIVGVITAPDKPAGRGMQLTQSAVKQFASEHSLNILQPEKLKNEDFLDQLRSLNADLQVVVAFRMLPEVVWSMPSMGTINLHGSLLPAYRGAAPINWAIIKGEKETGVTTFKLTHEIDTGNILLSESISIGEHETAGELHDRMKIIGANLLLKTVLAVGDGSLDEIPQNRILNDGTSIVSHAPKIFTETCRIDWNKGVDEIYNLVRGLSPSPAAFTMLNSKKLKIFSATKECESVTVPTGEFVTDHKTYLKFATANGYISIVELQLEGKKKIGIQEFLRGWRI